MLIPISAQTVSRPVSFEVASIRRNVDNIGTCSPDQVQPTHNGFHMTNCPLLMAVSLQEQLGLKLEPQKNNVENLIIDHVERPSPN